MQPKIEEMFFVSEIIASELVSLIVYIKNRIFLIGDQCLNKQSQDFAWPLERLFRKQFPC